MNGLDINLEQFATSFNGSLLAIALALLVWLTKSAFQKHSSETLSLARFERSYAFNLTAINDNLEFIQNWINSLNAGRPYKFYIEKPIVSDDETFKLSDLELINKIIWVNYKTRRITADLQTIYDSYWEVIAKIDADENEQRKANSISAFHSSVLASLESMKTNYPKLREEIIDVVAHIQMLADVKKHSIFGYVRFLFVDVFPRPDARKRMRIADEISAEAKRRYNRPDLWS